MKITQVLLVSAALLLSACAATQIQIPDSELRAEYDRVIARMTGQEYKVRHILFSQRSEAEVALARIKAGELFGTVAREVTIDAGSRPMGGELGWNKPQYFTPEFSEVMVRLAPKGLTPEPIKSRFGWHIIEVTDARKEQVPPFEEVKGKIETRLRQQRESDSKN